VFAFDEGRFGLKVWFRRRWCPYGVRPPWVYQDAYEWVWLYAAVEPVTGACFCLLLPRVTAECLQIFVDSFGEHVAEQVGLVPLPPYSPELNPVERLFEHLRAKLANRVFGEVAELETAITEELHQFWEEPRLLRSLTGYSWWLQGTQNMTKQAS
jgi:hypothetical protein